VGPAELGAATYKVPFREGFPETVLSDTGRAPWLVFNDGHRFPAVRFDGSDEHVALALPKDHIGAALRTAWHVDGEVVGVATWQASIVKKIPERILRERQAELDRAAAEDGAPIGHVSPYQTLAEAQRYMGDGGRTHELARFKPGASTDLRWLAVAAGPRHWAGAHWEVTDTSSTLVLSLFDYPSKLRGTRREAAPGGTGSGTLGIDDAGFTYVIADATSPFEQRQSLFIATFDDTGTRLEEHRVEAQGWVADSLVMFNCGGRPWLVYDAYATSGRETMHVLPLAPQAALPSANELWSWQDPNPSGEGSRPARILLPACGPQRAAVAMQINKDATVGWGDALVVAEWPL
jgi:hypothetical protein